jgi:hypothetical protein
LLTDIGVAFGSLATGAAGALFANSVGTRPRTTALGRIKTASRFASLFAGGVAPTPSFEMVKDPSVVERFSAGIGSAVFGSAVFDAAIFGSAVFGAADLGSLDPLSLNLRLLVAEERLSLFDSAVGASTGVFATGAGCDGKLPPAEEVGVDGVLSLKRNELGNFAGSSELPNLIDT